jgi:hypothetical protein
VPAVRGVPSSADVGPRRVDWAEATRGPTRTWSGPGVPTWRHAGATARTSPVARVEESNEAPPLTLAVAQVAKAPLQPRQVVGVGYRRDRRMGVGEFD